MLFQHGEGCYFASDDCLFPFVLFVVGCQHHSWNNTVPGVYLLLRFTHNNLSTCLFGFLCHKWTFCHPSAGGILTWCCILSQGSY
uniref:Uncharacterized protein n=1 Tax=Picea sitchensis TaxID=3332 RepID=D5A8D2_PICSI|nr:unknown [Picea sitchensis]